MPRSPLTESINKVRRLVTQIRDTLTVDEFNLLLDELVPEQEPEAKPTKKKRSASKSTKSRRASGMAEQLSSRRQEKEAHTLTVGEHCARCDYDNDHNIHHKETMVGFHPFQPPVSSAPPPSDQASSEIGKGGVSSAAQGAGGGD